MALVLYDVTKRSTFNNVAAWLKDLKEFGAESTSVMIVGSKADEEGIREVSHDEGMALATANGFMFTETSAVSGLNVELAFVTPAKLVMERVTQGYYDLSSDVSNTQSIGVKAAGDLVTRLSTEYVEPVPKKKCKC